MPGEILERLGSIVASLAGEGTPEEVQRRVEARVGAVLRETGVFEVLGVCPRCAKDTEASRTEEACACPCIDDACELAHCALCEAHVDAPGARCPRWIEHERALVDRLAGAAEPWPAKEAEQMRRQARQLMFLHDHGQLACMPPDERQLVRENCGACVLAEGVGLMEALQEPNYAGWARIYVQANVRIPVALLEQELARGDNLTYVEALRRDLATFGPRIGQALVAGGRNGAA